MTTSSWSANWASQSKDWDQTNHSPAKALLRIKILKDIHRAIHALKSKVMASPNLEESQVLHTIQERVRDIRSSDLTNHTLNEALDPNLDLPALSTQRELPKEIYSIIPKEKLHRFDRHWDREMLAEAQHLGWGLWALEAEIGIQNAEKFHEALDRSLWPHGIVLFAESAELKSQPTESWVGRWFIILENEPVKIDFHALPGYQSSESPVWKDLWISSNS